MFEKNKTVEQFTEILTRHYGGIYKRIDENRELLELLQREAPSLLATHPEAVSWLDSQDGFLRDIQAVVPLTEVQFPQRVSPSGKSFPRPWPLSCTTQPGTAANIWKMDKA